MLAIRSAVRITRLSVGRSPCPASQADNSRTSLRSSSWSQNCTGFPTLLLTCLAGWAFGRAAGADVTDWAGGSGCGDGGSDSAALTGVR